MNFHKSYIWTNFWVQKQYLPLHDFDVRCRSPPFLIVVLLVVVGSPLKIDVVGVLIG